MQTAPLPTAITTRTVLVEADPAARVHQLRDLERRWHLELTALIGAHPDQALHLSEALDDLQQLIRQLEP